MPWCFAAIPGPRSGGRTATVEFALLDAAHEGGVATPRVWFLLEADDGFGVGVRDGTNRGRDDPPPHLADDAYAAARPMLAQQCGEQAARIHALDPARLPAVPVQGARDQIALYRGYLDGFGEPHPAFELGLRWLADHAPPDPPQPRARSRRLPQRQPRRRSGRHPSRARLGARAPRRPGRGPRVAVREVVALRRDVDQRVGGFGTVDDLLAAYRAAGGGTSTRRRSSTGRRWAR